MSNVLDSPVWHALVGPQAGVAIGCRACHFPRYMAPFSEIESPTQEAYADLAMNLPPNTT